MSVHLARWQVVEYALIAMVAIFKCLRLQTDETLSDHELGELSWSVALNAPPKMRRVLRLAGLKALSEEPSEGRVARFNRQARARVGCLSLAAHHV